MGKKIIVSAVIDINYYLFYISKFHFSNWQYFKIGYAQYEIHRGQYFQPGCTQRCNPA